MSTAPTPIVSLIPASELRNLAEEPGVLSLVRFGAGPEVYPDGSPWISTGLEPLDPRPAPFLCWHVDASVETVQLGRFSARLATGLAMVGAVFSDVDDPAGTASRAYQELLDLARALGRPHILRVWQYLPRITEPCGAENRYKRFCAGRRLAYERGGIADTEFPAACLLGYGAGAFLIYALLAATPGMQVENPRQVSAFRYPREHGRVPPAFSRALAKTWPDGTGHLYISGTASVIGHASKHLDTLTQLHETLANIETLLTVNPVHGASTRTGLESIVPLTVYLRRPDDLPGAKSVLAARLPAEHPVMYLRADICRPELMVELEGIAVPG